MRWRRRYGTIDVTGAVQHGTLAALINNGKTKFYKRVMSLSNWYFKCTISGSWSCDGSGMLRARGAVLDGGREIGVVLFQK